MEAYSRSWAEWRLAWIFSRPSWAVGCRRPARRRRFPCTVRRCHGSVQSRVAITILALVNLVSLTCLQNGPNSGITNWFLKAFDRSPMFSRTTLWISKVCIWVWNFPVDSQLLISKINTYHNSQLIILSPFELPPIQLETLERSVAERLVLYVVQVVHHLLKSRVGPPDTGLLERLPEPSGITHLRFKFQIFS